LFFFFFLNVFLPPIIHGLAAGLPCFHRISAYRACEGRLSHPHRIRGQAETKAGSNTSQGVFALFLEAMLEAAYAPKGMALECLLFGP
jgi:hypothetical protein